MNAGYRPFILKVDSTKAGVSGSNQFNIITNLTAGYNYRIETDEGFSIGNLTGNYTITFTTSGVHTIKFYAESGFENVAGFGLRYANGDDKLKCLEITKWGDLLWRTNPQQAFYGCNNLSSISNDVHDGNIDAITDGYRFLRQCNLTSIPMSMTLENLQNGEEMFRQNSITDIGGLKLHSLTNGTTMFQGGGAINPAQLSALYIDMDTNNPNSGVVFNANNSFYDSSGVAARASLIGKGWIITDKGLI